MGSDEMKQLATFVDRVVSAHEDAAQLERIGAEVREVCRAFPAPGILQG
jgi:glycine/serine hydroxymethyltransferase